ncbi:MAG: type II secretion system major pseudopilin GspG [Clostridia bacterium]|nr:type II secretion system major pseudopilin GspG [Clostridia bacterium]
MLSYLRKIMKSDKGFTLIELMVVVIILGILAAVAIPRFTGRTEKAKENAAYADLKAISNALELYYFDEDAYPNDNGSGELPEVLVNEGYLQSIPEDPWGESYKYTRIENEGDDNYPYALYSHGSDGPGGSDIKL